MIYIFEIEVFIAFFIKLRASSGHYHKSHTFFESNLFNVGISSKQFGVNEVSYITFLAKWNLSKSYEYTYFISIFFNY